MATYLNPAQANFPDPVLYTPDFSYMDKMLRRKQAMYEQGYSQVAGKYNTLNKEMTHAANQQFRDQFLKQATENLKNLSAMDLSIPQNVQAAAGVFEPFYNNKLALKDLGFTSMINNEKRRAEADRDRENGKFYNAASVQLIQRMQDEYRSDNPEAIDYYSSNMPKYRHYVDYTKTIMDAYAKFKPSTSGPMTYVNGEWLVTETTTMQDPLEFRRFLDTVLSPQEKEQIAIEGMAKYGRNPEMLTQIYTNDLSAADTQIARLNEQKLLAKTENDRKEIDQKIEYYNNYKTNKLSNLERLSDPDKYRARAAADNIAADFYVSEVLNKAGALYKPTRSRDLKINDAWKIKFDWAQKIAEREDTQAHQFELEAFKLQNDKTKSKKSDDALTGSSFVLNAANATDMGGLTGLEQQMALAENQMKEADKVIAENLIKQGIRPEQLSNSIQEFKNKYSDLATRVKPVYNNGKLSHYEYRDNGKKVEPVVLQQLDVFNQYTQSLAPAMMKYNTLKSFRNQLDEEVKNNTGAKFYNSMMQQLATVPPVTITRDGKSSRLTANDLFDGLVTGSVKIYYPPSGQNTYGGPMASSYQIPTGTKAVINGVSYNLEDPKMGPLLGVLNRINGIYNSEDGKKFRKAQEDIFRSNLINNASIGLLDVESGYYKEKLGEAKQLLGSDVEIAGLDYSTGRLAVRLKDQTEDAKEQIVERTKGRPGVQYDETNDLFFITGLTNTDVTQNYSPLERAIFETADAPYLGKYSGENMWSLESGSPVRLAGLPYNFFWKRVSRKNQGVDNTTLLTHSYSIYSELNPTTPLDLAPIRSPFELVANFRFLGANPAMTAQLVESSTQGQ